MAEGSRADAEDAEMRADPFLTPYAVSVAKNIQDHLDAGGKWPPVSKEEFEGMAGPEQDALLRRLVLVGDADDRGSRFNCKWCAKAALYGGYISGDGDSGPLSLDELFAFEVLEFRSRTGGIPNKKLKKEAEKKGKKRRRWASRQ